LRPWRRLFGGLAWHSFRYRHCTQIEYLDTGVVVTSASKVDSAARGFVRLAWNEDGWGDAQ